MTNASDHRGEISSQFLLCLINSSSIMNVVIDQLFKLTGGLISCDQ